MTSEKHLGKEWEGSAVGTYSQILKKYMSWRLTENTENLVMIADVPAEIWTGPFKKYKSDPLLQKQTCLGNMLLPVSVAECMMWLKELCRKVSAPFDTQYFAIALGNVRFTAGSSPLPWIIRSLVRNLLVNINRSSFQELKAKHRSALHDCLFALLYFEWFWRTVSSWSRL